VNLNKFVNFVYFLAWAWHAFSVDYIGLFIRSIFGDVVLKQHIDQWLQFSLLFNGAIVLPNPIKPKSPCVLQDILPFGVAALLTITYIDKHIKQGNGYR